MRFGSRILLLWASGVAASVISLIVFPTAGAITPSIFLSYSLQLLLFIISIYIARHEPTRKNRLIFINFALFFSTSVLFHLYNFLGVSILPNIPYLRFYFTQFVALSTYFFLLALCVVYLAIDALFREFRSFQKYLLALAIVGGFFGYYYAPFFADPLYAYRTETALNFKELSQAATSFENREGRAPTAEELVQSTEMHMWRDGVQVGVLYPDERARRVNELFPYLPGESFKILFLAPLYRNVIYMNVICVGFILLFFGYQYRKDPPQGAYIEKIVFLLFLFCSMEILHAWSFIKSLEWQTFYEITGIGQYVSALFLLLICGFFWLRLRFITSVNGEFYELEIVSRPAGITRWRDWLDEMVIAHFFNRKAILGRLFVRPGRKDTD